MARGRRRAARSPNSAASSSFPLQATSGQGANVGLSVEGPAPAPCAMDDEEDDATYAEAAATTAKAFRAARTAKNDIFGVRYGSCKWRLIIQMHGR